MGGISSILDALGLDSEDLEWHDLAICHNMPLSRFYEDYESNARRARLTDQICLSCPVRKQCLQAGIENNEWGVWGSIYLENGRISESKNAHKTQDIWDEIEDGIG